MTAEIELTFHVAPANQGQIVEVAYAVNCEGEVVRRITDRSDGSVQFSIADMADDDEGDYWQSEPESDDWRSLTAKEMERYGLALPRQERG